MEPLKTASSKEKLLNETSGMFMGPIQIEILIKEMISSDRIVCGLQEDGGNGAKTSPQYYRKDADKSFSYTGDGVKGYDVFYPHAR